MFQLRLSDQQFYCLLRRDLYWSLDGNGSRWRMFASVNCIINGSGDASPQCITWINAENLRTGGRLNIKMSSYQNRDPYDKDKTVSRPSLTWESPYMGKTVFILRRGPGSLAKQVLQIRKLPFNKMHLIAFCKMTDSLLRNRCVDIWTRGLFY